MTTRPRGSPGRCTPATRSRRRSRSRSCAGAAGRGRGLGTEATTRLVVDHGFRVLGLHRISLEVFDVNPRARHVYEKVGFVHEGTGRDALLLDGEWVDVRFMAVLEPDWVYAAHQSGTG